MDNGKNLEYIFWLDYWRNASRQLPKSGHFKCIVTRKNILIHTTDNDPTKALNLDISSILAYKLGYGGRNKQVDLILSDQKIYLGPVHPIDPHFIQNLNHNEALSLVKLIEAFRSNIDPGIDPNPYTRQLSAKNYLVGFKLPNIEWDMHISPWHYFKRYQDRFLELKITIRKIAIIIASAIIGTLIILALFSMLLALNVF